VALVLALLVTLAEALTVALLVALADELDFKV